MYRGRLWTMRQFAGFGTAEETNERFRYLLDHGQTGLSTAFDMPSLMGHDSDHPRSLGEVGREGVAIDTIDDMETLFAGIPLDEVSVSMTINAPAAIMLAFYVAAAERQGVPPEKLAGTIQTDILKEYIAQKEWCFPIDPAMRLVGDLIEWCSEHMPRWHPISISGYHIREAGSTAAQELAFTLKDGLTYVEQAVARGLDVDDFAPRLSFFFNAHIDLFEEVAKYRAARRIWARELRDTFGARDERSLLMRFHTQTAGVSLTAQQPLNNIVRTTIEALAGVLGGTQSLHTNSYDEALALPTEEAVRLALRTQQVIAHESGVANTIDPLGGALLRRGADRRDGAPGLRRTSPRSTSSAGWSRRSSAASRSARSPTPPSATSRRSSSGERVVVGVNALRAGGRRRARHPAYRPRARGQAGRPPPGAPRAPRRRRRRGRARRLREAAAQDGRNLMPACSIAPARTPRRARSSRRCRRSSGPTPNRPSSSTLAPVRYGIAAAGACVLALTVSTSAAFGHAERPSYYPNFDPIAKKYDPAPEIGPAGSVPSTAARAPRSSSARPTPASGSAPFPARRGASERCAGAIWPFGAIAASGTSSRRSTRRATARASACSRASTRRSRAAPSPTRTAPSATACTTRSEEQTGTAPSYQYQLNCPNAQNLIAIIGDSPSDPDRICDRKCNIQIQGTGRGPSDVLISGERTKLNVIRADRADGIHLSNFTVEYSDFNNIYVLETNGFQH